MDVEEHEAANPDAAEAVVGDTQPQQVDSVPHPQSDYAVPSSYNIHRPSFCVCGFECLCLVSFCVFCFWLFACACVFCLCTGTSAISR